MRGGGGHRLPVVRVIEFHVGVGRGGARRRCHLVGVHYGPFRNGLPHDAAPDQEGPIQVLRRQVAVVRVAGGGGRHRGPAQAAGEAAQDVAELRRRPQGRAPGTAPLRGRQERGVQGAAVLAGARLGAEETDDGDAAAGDGDAGGGGRATSVICLGDSPAHLYCKIIRDAVFLLFIWRGSWK